MRKLEQKDTDISPIVQAPFMTVGEQFIIKPLDPQTLNSILSGCPLPQKNPQAAVNYLKRTTKTLNCTGEDYKIILQGIMGYDEENEFDWKEIPPLKGFKQCLQHRNLSFQKARRY